MIARRDRWTWRFDITGKDVTCPSGHPFEMSEVWSDKDCLQCFHKAPHTGREDCGRRIYLAPMLRYRATPCLMAWEVSATEVEVIKTLKKVEEIFAVLYPVGDKRVA